MTSSSLEKQQIGLLFCVASSLALSPKTRDHFSFKYLIFLSSSKLLYDRVTGIEFVQEYFHVISFC